MGSVVTTCPPSLFLGTSPDQGIIGRIVIEPEVDEATFETRVAGACVWYAAFRGNPFPLHQLSEAWLNEFADLLKAQRDADAARLDALILEAGLRPQAGAPEPTVSSDVTTARRDGRVYIDISVEFRGAMTAQETSRAVYWSEGSVLAAIIVFDLYGSLDGGPRASEPETPSLDDLYELSHDRLKAALATLD